MTTEVKEITVEDLRQTRTRQVADVTEAKQAQESALQAFSKQQKSANVTDLLALAKAVETSKSAVEAAERKVKATDAQITLAEWGEKSVPLTEMHERAAEVVSRVLEADAAVLKTFGVKSMTVTASGLDTDSPVISAKSVGEGIPTTTRARATSNGAKGRVKFQTPNGPLGSLELLEQYGPTSDIAERCAAMVADPERGRKGMSHLARTLAEKLNFPIS